MGFFKALLETVEDVTKRVVEKAEATWQAAKSAGARAIVWMAEEAEIFIDKANQAWKTIEPHVAKMGKILRTLALGMPWPWLRARLSLFADLLERLPDIIDSELARAMRAALNWLIKLAQRFQERATNGSAESDPLNDEDLKTAKEHRETFTTAERKFHADEDIDRVRYAAFINDFEIARRELADAQTEDIEGLDHYLRLSAAQQLLIMAESHIREAKTFSQLNRDDVFLVRAVPRLIGKNQTLSSEDANTIDRILMSRCGKGLLPFVFEGMIVSWTARAQQLDTEWAEVNKEHSKNMVIKRRLDVAKRLEGELSKEESRLLETLESDIPEQKFRLDDLAVRYRDTNRYANAAEGLLQLLEKTPEQLEKEGHGYLLKNGARVGELIIKCARSQIPFSQLSKSEQDLLTDYANIFAADAQTRKRNYELLPYVTV